MGKSWCVHHGGGLAPAVAVASKPTTADHGGDLPRRQRRHHSGKLTVPVVYININDRDSLQSMRLQRVHRPDGDVVEDAETAAHLHRTNMFRPCKGSMAHIAQHEALSADVLRTHPSGEDLTYGKLMPRNRPPCLSIRRSHDTQRTLETNHGK